MNIQDLFQHVPDLASVSTSPIILQALTVDSREIVPGALFVAVRGVQADGHRYLDKAAASGAAAAIGEDAWENPPIPYYQVPNSRRVFCELAAAWYGFPARKLKMIGVTGTDGKTTTVNLIYHILKEAGIPTGMISTVNALIGDQSLDTGLHVTTPDPMEMQALLAGMVKSGLTHAVLEVTSHGLAQHRILPAAFQVAVLTNITHEHLDYHGSFEAYRDAKAMLFSAEPEKTGDKTCILNFNDPSFEYIHTSAYGRTVSYGSEGGDYSPRNIQFDSTGLQAVLKGPRGEFSLKSSLLGAYNVSNILAAYAAAVEGLGISPEMAARGIAALDSIPGRMELIDLGQPFMAVVDFAHTPNALQVTLETCRSLTDGKVIAVFGSAGLRDREKRRMMAEVSAQNADATYLTAEDPRTEDLDFILADMAAGAAAAGAVETKTFWRIPDRGEAITIAIYSARPGDLVVICGKGHEKSMCFGETEVPWDDRIAVRAALSSQLGLDGPEMPGLPTRNVESKRR